MGSTAPTRASSVRRSDVRPDLPWVTIVWNDPVNLMSYVTYVFQTVFGYSKEKAEKLMLDVHHKGRAVVVQRHPRGDGARRAGPARLRPVGDRPAGSSAVRRRREFAAFIRRRQAWVPSCASVRRPARGVDPALAGRPAPRPGRAGADRATTRWSGRSASARRPSVRPTRCWPGCSPTAYARTRRRPRSSAATPRRRCATASAPTRQTVLDTAPSAGRVDARRRAGAGVAARAQRPAAGARHPAGGHRGVHEEIADDVRRTTPATRRIVTYDWLTYLQDTLVRALW